MSRKKLFLYACTEGSTQIHSDGWWQSVHLIGRVSFEKKTFLITAWLSVYLISCLCVCVCVCMYVMGSSIKKSLMSQRSVFDLISNKLRKTPA